MAEQRAVFEIELKEGTTQRREITPPPPSHSGASPWRDPAVAVPVTGPRAAPAYTGPHATQTAGPGTAVIPYAGGMQAAGPGTAVIPYKGTTAAIPYTGTTQAGQAQAGGAVVPATPQKITSSTMGIPYTAGMAPPPVQRAPTPPPIQAAPATPPTGMTVASAAAFAQNPVGAGLSQVMGAGHPMIAVLAEAIAKAQRIGAAAHEGAWRAGEAYAVGAHSTQGGAVSALGEGIDAAREGLKDMGEIGKKAAAGLAAVSRVGGILYRAQEAAAIKIEKNAETFGMLARGDIVGAQRADKERQLKDTRAIPAIGEVLAWKSGIRTEVALIQAAAATAVQAHADTQRLAQYSGPISAANARVEAMQITSDVARAQRIGPGLANLAELTGAREEATRRVFETQQSAAVEKLADAMRSGTLKPEQLKELANIQDREKFEKLLNDNSEKGNALQKQVLETLNKILAEMKDNNPGDDQIDALFKGLELLPGQEEEDLPDWAQQGMLRPIG